MKKQYVDPEMRVVRFEDIIVTSGTAGGFGSTLHEDEGSVVTNHGDVADII